MAGKLGLRAESKRFLNNDTNEFVLGLRSVLSKLHDRSLRRKNDIAKDLETELSDGKFSLPGVRSGRKTNSETAEQGSLF